MGSKKHKDKDRERKKHRKARSRSRSRERESKHSSHRDKDKKRNREYYDHDEFLLEKQKEKKRLREYYEEDDLILEKVKIKDEPPFELHSKIKQELSGLEEGEIVPCTSSGDISLSINDTNKLRAKLGLKPLEAAEVIPGLGDDNAEGNAEDDGKKKEIFIKTENLSEKKQAQKLKEKIAVQREKRKIAEKLRKIKGLGDSDSDDEGAAAWIERSRRLQEEKDKAEKRAKLLEEMDEEFGIGALVEEEFKEVDDYSKRYTSKDLKGLTIGHSQHSFKEGRHVVLTLKDRGVLEDDEDVLENVNLVDDEKANRNAENRKRKPDYKPYEEPEFDEFGILKKKTLLAKYDEEIEGPQQNTFKIATASSLDREKELELIRMKLKQKQGVTLDMPSLKIASEYYTPEEMVHFKKPKRKVRKVRKREILKPEDILPLTVEEEQIDHGSRHKKKPDEEVDPEISKLEDEFLYGSDQAEEEMTVDPVDPSESEEPVLVEQEIQIIEKTTEDATDNHVEDYTGIKIEEDQAEAELQAALNKAQKLKQREALTSAPQKVIEVLKKASDIKKEEKVEKPSRGKTGAIVLNSIAEFCRTLGEIPTYGMSGNRDEEAEELLDFEKELLEERKEAQNRGAWNEVDIDENPVEIKDRQNEPILEEEPDVSSGLAGALQLAMKKGYLDKEVKKLISAPRPSQLHAQTYTIEEKFYEDDKFGKRDRYTGPIQDFRERDGYKPDVKLEYIDDGGRLLTAKEAFRYLSHKFHGKGPGKNKVDKRMKKLEQEARLKQMSSTDTPLGTLRLLQEKQKEMQSPYIMLSGGSKALTQTMISKPK